jgi:branched-chain amino acid transport system permease protein
MKILGSPSRLRSAEEQLRSEGGLLIEQVSLGDKLDALAGELSYGQQKVLEIIRAILANPSLLLFDEPAAGLDLSIKKVVAGLIHDLKEKGKTVVLIEHDLGFVRSICDQVVVLDQGAPIFIGKPEDLAGDPLVKERYLSEGAYM